ncbi:TolB family protein [Kitasatospora sp. NPDC059408]|uniref:TolB family protein n=1 Tax=Kitasatospora sp. NPDC059408 TaxID=3346823 RepID=UPI0036AE57AB
MTTNRWLLRGGGAVLAAAVLTAVAAPAEARPPKGDTARVSVGLDGAQPNGDSTALGLSANGRYALFSSTAANLVPGDTNNAYDVFLRDLRNGHVQRVSVADDGSQLNGPTTQASLSANGRYVVFSSGATNAVAGQATNNAENIYVRDLWAGRTELITAGDPHPAQDQTGRGSHDPVISADGRYVAFASSRSDLVPGAKRGKEHVFVTDRRAGTTRQLDVGPDGSTGSNNAFRPSISADGAVIGFTSAAGNLLPDAPAASDAPAGTAELAAGIRWYSFYVYDQRTGKLTGGSLDPAGALQPTGNDGVISADGRYAVYSLPEPGGLPPHAGVHLDVYLRDLREGTVTKVSAPLPGTTTRGSSQEPAISADDRYVVFSSDADNLVPGLTANNGNVLRRDLRTGRTEVVSVAGDGSVSQGGSSYGPFIDADGDKVLFSAFDGTLVPGDTNNASDVFLHRF